MKEWDVSAESVEGMRKLSEALNEQSESFRKELTKLKNAFKENIDGLGAHTANIEECIEMLNILVGESEKNVNRLALKLLKSATIRQAHIENSTYGSRTSDGSGLATASFITDISGIKDTLSLGSGSGQVKQLSGSHKEVQRKDGKGYESHHIPSASVLKEFGINTQEWPTIALLKEDHKATDSYAGKQKKKAIPLFADSIPRGTYKQECVELLDRPGGFFELVRDEVLNIREQCGEKYDGAISQYLDQIVEYVARNGVPQRK